MYKLSKEQKMEMYDVLVTAGRQVIKTLNPCRWNNGVCINKRNCELCCKDCKHLGPNGCTVDSLACILWLCGDWDTDENIDDVFRKCKRILFHLKKIAEISRIPLRQRKSKEQNFEWI